MENINNSFTHFYSSQLSLSLSLYNLVLLSRIHCILLNIHQIKFDTYFSDMGLSLFYYLQLFLCLNLRFCIVIRNILILPTEGVVGKSSMKEEHFEEVLGSEAVERKRFGWP